MTKFFIAVIIGCGLLIPAQSFAEVTTKTDVKKELKKDIVPKKQSKKSVTIKGVAKKAATKNSKKGKKPARKVVRVDFDKSPQPAKKVQLVSHKDFKKKDLRPANRKPASNAMTVDQLKKSTKPYWSAYCRDGIVLNSHVYCALKNPQKQALKAAKKNKMAANKDMEAKKRK